MSFPNLNMQLPRYRHLSKGLLQMYINSKWPSAEMLSASWSAYKSIWIVYILQMGQQPIKILKHMHNLALII